MDAVDPDLPLVTHPVEEKYAITCCLSACPLSVVLPVLARVGRLPGGALQHEFMLEVGAKAAMLAVG